MIKVGDWVNWEGMVTRVLSIQDDMAELYTGNGQRCEYVEDLQKLPIKFKAMNIGVKDVDKLKWDCCRTQKGVGNIHFVCIQEGKNYFFTGFKVPHKKFVTKHFTTPDQARDWLELQYATMLAKARGLI